MSALWDTLRGGLRTRALALVAELGIAQSLKAGPRNVDELAAASGADADTLYRLLRALASDGIFEETEPGVFQNTTDSEALTEDGWDAFARLFGGNWLQAVADLRADGTASFPRVFGNEFWSWLAEHPGERALFDRSMQQNWQRRIERLESVGFRGDETIVDVGGGNGAQLLALLERHPQMRGIVFDLPETVRDESTFGERCTFVAGSFFERVPAGDVFVLSTILHDWDDDSARRILETIRATATAESRLVLLEAIIEPGNEPSGAKWLDLLMLVISAGRERSEAQWRTLLAGAGWEPLSFGDAVIEARPA